MKTPEKTETACSGGHLDPLVGCDASRYRWLVSKLQEAYDGNDLEIGDLVVGCSMQYGHRNERCVMGVIRWIDARDEPLNLDAAIDAAMTHNMEFSGRGETQQLGGAAVPLSAGMES